MSMSTLGAQLAALQSANQGHSSALPTSRRHEDAVGRGMAHSVNLGHSSMAKSHLFKASILLEDAKAASNVPLATVQENCIVSLRSLEELDPVFGGYVASLCENATERGLNTKEKNAMIDSTIQELLFRLALRMNSSKDVIATCLHVIEFLLRRYDLHLRPKLVSTTLLVLLPHHEQPYFLRFLQLVDLASLPMWSWLRPYAIPNARVGRELIGKHASKNVALFRELLVLATKSAPLPEADPTLSFVAATIVHAMTLQQRAHGTVDERTCQALLPTIIQACRSSVQGTHQSYRNLGYILASTLVETAVLAQEPRTLLITSVLQGLSGGKTEDGIKANGLVVALTLLQQPTDKHSTAESMDNHLVVANKRYGYAMEKSVLQALLQIDNIVGMLAVLLVDEGIVDFQHWIASIWVVGWKRIQRKKKDQLQIETLLKELLDDPRLTQYLWTPEWVEAVTCFVLTNTPVPEGDDESFLQSTLQILRQKRPLAYDRGITQALLRLRKDERIRLAQWLGLSAQKSLDGNPSEPAPTIQLPARVALEHADVEVRLEAIGRVLPEADNEMLVEGDESVIEALVRRVLVDNDIHVAIKAAEAVNQLLSKSFTVEPESFASNARQAMYRWTGEYIADKATKSNMMLQLLHILSGVARHLHDKEEPLTLLVEAIGSNLSNTDTKLVQEAANSLVRALSSTSTSKKTSVKEACRAVVSSKNLLPLFARRTTDAMLNEEIVRRRCFPHILAGFADSTKKGTKKDETLQLAALEYCLWGLSVHAKTLDEESLNLVSRVLTSAANCVGSKPDMIPATFFELARLDPRVYDAACFQFVVDVCASVQDQKQRKVAGLAVVMEVALRSVDAVVTERLLETACRMLESQPEGCQLGLIPAMALLESSDDVIRKKAITFLSMLGSTLSQSIPELKKLSAMCKYVSENESSATMGGSSFLAGCLKSFIKNTGKSEELRKTFLRFCLYSAMAIGTSADLDSEDLSKQGWLNFSNANGGHRACLVLLNAAQCAGEEAFPLLTRWQVAGKPILQSTFMANGEEAMPVHLSNLVEHVTLMLKGQKTTDFSEDTSKRVIITSGPATRGGRRRSYSFGKSEPSSYLAPYPKDMIEEILLILTSEKADESSRKIRNLVSQQTLASESWGINVFSALPQSTRQKITFALLNATSSNLADSAEDALFALPIPCHDLAQLLRQVDKSDSYLTAATYIADYIASHSKRLVTEKTVSEVLVGLMDKFAQLVTKPQNDDDDVEFVCVSVLDAISELFAVLPEDGAEALSLNAKKEFKHWMSALVGALGSSDDKIRYLCLSSPRGKRAALSVLTSLSSLYPITVVPRLIPAIACMIASTKSEKDANIVAACLGSVNHVYFEHAAAAKLPAAGLMNTFIAAANDNVEEEIRMLLYMGFVDSLSKDPMTREEHLGAFIADCLASDLYFATQKHDYPTTTGLATQILSHESVSTRLLAVLALATYSRDFILKIAGENGNEEFGVLSIDDLAHIAATGPKQEAKRNVAEEIYNKVCVSLLGATLDIVSSAAFCRFLHHAQADSSAFVLRLWQCLLLIQSVCNNKLGSSEGDSLVFWRSVAEIISDTLDCIQTHLPSHIFLAFATSLVKESDADDLRARALQMIAERSSTLEPGNLEAGLFRDMLPFLLSLLKIDGKSGTIAVLQQSTFFAIENIVRNLCLPGESYLQKYQDSIVAALGKSASMIAFEANRLNGDKAGFETLEDSTRQLLCTATLCASTTIRVCGPRGLPVLPKLLPPSLTLFSAINKYIDTFEGDRKDDEKQARLLQLSLLRMILGLVDTMPQFMAPYLGTLFRPDILPSKTLKQVDDDQSAAVKTVTDRLCQTLAKAVPMRQLLPPLTTSVTLTRDSSAVDSLISIMTMSISISNGPQLSGQVNTVLRAGTYALELAGSLGASSELVSSSNAMILAMVMKLSEVHLRSLYSKLREWRGTLDKTNPLHQAFRRYGFWSLSATLSASLKTIFLPCLSTVFSDAVEELDTAATFLCKRTGVKTAGGKKKQRLDEVQELSYNSDSLMSLQALLKCLEVSLRSDAHNGGAWIRESDIQRFETLLAPLSKLLQCTIAGELSPSVSFQSLVHGNSDDMGSVVDCIVALASAAGDEQLWKPLNHAVLQAASHESRPEVRKAGIHCLVSLVKSIGEEYMVLIPECLPVLSELLEDSDEEIAGMAQECISISEELLGESLEDSLR